MPYNMTIHFDNYNNFAAPTLLFESSQSEIPHTISKVRQNDEGFVFELEIADDTPLVFRFGDENGESQEDDKLIRYIAPDHFGSINEVWVRSWNPFVYTTTPKTSSKQTAEEFLAQYDFAENIYVSDTDGRLGLGATKTSNGVLFGLFHPHAARVFVAGDFNNWQFPAAEEPDPEKFYELELCKGYFGVPNIWYAYVDDAQIDQEYRFYIEYETLAGEHIYESRFVVDPYARFLSENFDLNNSVIVDPTRYEWHDNDFSTPAIHDLIIYELHVHGFTHDALDIDIAHQGTYQGIIDRINAGYFDKLGITCLYLMPISEVPTPQGADALGYNTSLYMAVERDFGTPDELRQLVDVAHQHGLAVIVDQVFNHTSNSWNPLWKYILDHPDEYNADAEGGIYFSGSSPWGNRVATERTETQNMLIDACKLMITEYHLDGFRFDATHSMYIDHGFLHRLADELQAHKPDVVLIAENLPNQADLNREGYNGFGQWCDYFHDTIKAMLREGKFEGTDNYPENLGDIFYFSKGKYAAHTNNVVNYCETHDEHSVAHEVSSVASLNNPSAKDRKSRLGLFATMVALGQPMIYMGQEFGVDRERNLVYFDFPQNLEENGFYQWASRLISLRKRYPALKLHGFNPIEDGQFEWILGTWLGESQGGGKRVLGWRAKPSDESYDQMVILINLENYPVEVDIPFGDSGKWVRLASIEYVNDIPPVGNNNIDNDDTVIVQDGLFRGFTLPDSSAFIYKWEADN